MSQELYAAAHRTLSAATVGLRRRQSEPGVAEVIERLAQQDLSQAAFQAPRPSRPAACRHLPQTVAAAIMVDSSLAAAIAALEDGLDWRQTQGYSDAAMGQPGFMDNYAHAEIIGPTGCFPGDDFRLGFVLLGPGLHYRDHYHPAPELYWPLTGPSEWKRNGGAFVTRQAGETLWHDPLVVHATRTGPAPLLAMFAWTRDADTPPKLVGS